jgi:DNA-binding NtrC family response regulator
VEFEYTSDVDGHHTTYSFIRVPLKDSLGRVTGLAGIGRDITELRRRETPSEVEGAIDRPEKYPSASMKRTLRQVRRAAKTDSICLFLGESGSGKDYLARYLHDCSSRSRGPFFSINCATLIPELAESELFGHELGAFTGAAKRKRGLLELAESGTLLLNEITELSLHLQAKFLAFLDTDSFTRVGGETNIKVNARVVAATNRDLEAEVEAGTFRKDLYYRLNVLAIRVPSVRERMEDLPLLVGALMGSFAKKMGLHQVPTVDAAAMELLMSYDWPGNVRELRNVLERALILGDKRRITAKDIDLVPRDRIQGQKTGLSVTVNLGDDITMNDALREAKRMLVEACLGRAGGLVTEAARLLGVSRDAMNYLLRSLRSRNK